MKTLKLENIELEIAEGLGDITASREKDIRQLYFMILEGNETPQSIMVDCIKYFNEGQYVNLAQTLKNYLDYLKISEKHNIWGSIFCLISFEKGEEKTTLSELQIKNKLERLEKKGLMFDVVKKEVENFMKAYPQIIKIYNLIRG